MKKIAWVMAFIIVFTLGEYWGEYLTQHRAYIPDWSPRIPYKQFFEEERKTIAPINTVYIKNWAMHVETIDGNFDIIPLEIKYR